MTKDQLLHNLINARQAVLDNVRQAALDNVRQADLAHRVAHAKDVLFSVEKFAVFAQRKT